MNPDQVDLQNEPMPSTVQASSSYQFPVDIPSETRGWFRGLIPNPQVTYVSMSLAGTAWTAAATTKNLTLFTLPAYCEVISAFMSVDTAFAGTATATMSVGLTGTETVLLTAQDVKTVGLKVAKGTDFTTNRPVYSLTAGTNIVAKLTTNTNTSNVNAGRLRFFFAYVNHTNS